MKNNLLRKAVAVLAAAMLLVAGFPIQMVTSAEGETDWTGYTAVSTKEELNAVRNDPTGKYYLTTDIVFTEADYAESGAYYNEGQGWNPIVSFAGIFDGNGYTITGLYVNIKSESPVLAGLFSYNRGTIQNLGMVDGSVSITALRAPDVSVYASKGSTNYSTLLLPSTDNYMAGSIAGGNDASGAIINCYNTGSVTESVISTTSPYYSYILIIGGITGDNCGTISNCYNTGSVTPLSSKTDAGGIAGSNIGTISSCYNTSTMTLSASNINAGGIVGDNQKTICNCYNTGNLIVSTSLTLINAGGIAGVGYGDISNCYNIGNLIVSSENINAGAIVGKSGTITTNCYYLDVITKGVGSGTDTSIYCTEEQLQLQTTFIDFDFDNVWELKENSDYPCPTLKAVRHVEPEENTTEFLGGNGTYFNPYIVSDKEQLNAVCNYLNASFKLTNDIVFSETDFTEGGTYYNDGAGWSPIGISTTSVFTGCFDGNGYTITGLYVNITSSSNDVAGLFGYNMGIIKNIGMVGGSVNITSSSDVYAGSITGYNTGTISKCYSTGSVSANAVSNSSTHVGGISGYNFGNITYCYNTGILSATSSSSVYAGGIAGENSDNGDITNSYNTGYMSANTDLTTSIYIGGIVGCNYGDITYCYNTGILSATSSSSVYAGGIAGENNIDGTITISYNTGEVNVTSSSNLTTDNTYVGGIVGNNNCIYFHHGIITNCYNTGAVNATASLTDACVGGIAGNNNKNKMSKFITKSTITNCYNIGKVNAVSSLSNAYIGGIAGINSGIIGNGYYLNNTIKGAGSGTDTAVSCTEEQLYTQATFVDFDFINVWVLSNEQTYLFPTLKSSPIIESISIITLPSKLTYFFNTTLNTTGMVLRISYNDSTVTKETSGWTTSYDFSELNYRRVTVFYGNKSITFDVDVVPVTNIQITAKPHKLTYIQNTVLDTTSMVLMLSSYGDITDTITSGWRTTYDFSTPGINTVTVYYGEKSTTFDVTVIALTDIAIVTKPDKLTYIQNTVLDTTGMVLTLSGDNDMTETVTSEFKTTYDFSTPGTNTVTISYGEKSISFDVTVVALTDIVITTKPYELTYIQNTVLNTTGMVLTLFGDNDTTETVTSGWRTTCDFSTPGISTVTVSYDGKSTTFEVNVVKKSLSNIAVITKPDKLTYNQNTVLDTTGMALLLFYDNDTCERITSGWTAAYDFSIPGISTVTVFYGGKSTTFNVSVTEKSLSNIWVITMPDKLIYLQNTALDTTGMVLTLSYDNDTTETITSGWTATYDFSIHGTRTVTISYGGKSTTYDVSVTEKSLSNIAVITMPDKLIYPQNTALDTTGMVLTLSYDNDTTETITSGWETTCDFSILGTRTVTVFYGGKSTMFDVTVTEKSVNNISIASMPSKLKYHKNTVLDTTGMVLTLLYDNDTTETITSGWETVYDFRTPGISTVTISYGGKSTTFDVTVQTFFGDIDVNSQVTAADALMALQASVEKVTLTEEQKEIADVDGSSEVTANDALLILQYAVGKINVFPVG